MVGQASTRHSVVSLAVVMNDSPPHYNAAIDTAEAQCSDAVARAYARESTYAHLRSSSTEPGSVRRAYAHAPPFAAYAAQIAAAKAVGVVPSSGMLNSLPSSSTVGKCASVGLRGKGPLWLPFYS